MMLSSYEEESAEVTADESEEPTEPMADVPQEEEMSYEEGNEE